jgi:hypothetical protein
MTLFWNNDNTYYNKILIGLYIPLKGKKKERKENKTERIVETLPFVS